MVFYIPSLGSRFVLDQHWSVPIYKECRNELLISKLRQAKERPLGFSDVERDRIQITFPKGSIFKVARIYIRAGMKFYDSVTLVTNDIPGIKSARFWVKLVDINGTAVSWLE